MGRDCMREREASRQHVRVMDLAVEEVAPAVRRYVAARDAPGASAAARSRALHELGEILCRHDLTVEVDGRTWRWSRSAQDVISEPLTRTWRKPEDPHAAPHRVAWDLMPQRSDVTESLA